jgi:hypothetical protein
MIERNSCLGFVVLVLLYRINILLLFLKIALFCSSRYEGDSREEGLKNSTMASTPFHLAIPVHDIEAAREFFGGYVIFFPLNMHAVEPPPACHPRIFPVNVMLCICVTQKSFTAQ